MCPGGKRPRPGRPPSRAPLELPTTRSGTGPADFEVILGCYRLDHSQLHRFLPDLPPVLRHIADRSEPAGRDTGIAGMSRSVFKRKFTAQVGQPPMT